MLVNPFQLCRSREFNRRLEESRGRLYRMAFAWSHNPSLAEDLVQDTLTKALKNTSQLRELDSIDAWLFSILANCWRDSFRRSRDMEDIDALSIAHDTTPERLHGQQEIVSLVRGAVGQLPDGQRQVLTLVDLEGFSYNEVAEILQVPIGTVMSRLCRARKLLKGLLLEANAQEVDALPRIRRVK
jgi:RNA polymerase sigma-70 factor (ECF subfamily)